MLVGLAGKANAKACNAQKREPQAGSTPPLDRGDARRLHEDGFSKLIVGLYGQTLADNLRFSTTSLSVIFPQCQHSVHFISHRKRRPPTCCARGSLSISICHAYNALNSAAKQGKRHSKEHIGTDLGIESTHDAAEPDRIVSEQKTGDERGLADRDASHVWAHDDSVAVTVAQRAQFLLKRSKSSALQPIAACYWPAYP